MNLFEFAILGILVQTTLFAVIACIVCGLVQMTTRRWPTGPLFLSLCILIAIWFVAFFPLPAWWSISGDSLAEWAASQHDSEAAVSALIAEPEFTENATYLPGSATESNGTDSGDASPELEINQILPTGANVPLRIEDTGIRFDPRPAAGLSGVFLLRVTTWLALGAVAFGIVRLTLGLASILWLRRQLTTINDDRLIRLVGQLQSKLDCSMRIRVAEHRDLSTAATVGWLNPTLILPLEWSAWPDEKLAAVCAHEISHISNRDYLGNLIAQFSAAINFYNPLVHWLATQLRMAQEIAADRTAAVTVGGSESYLKILAEMALDEDVKPAGWLAPSFLPTQRMLLRRVQMLKRTKRGPSARRQYGSITARLVLVLVAVLLLGIRLSHPDPATASGAADPAQHPVAAGQSDGRAIGDTAQHDAAHDLVPRSANMFFVIRPAEILASELFDPDSGDAHFAKSLEQLTAAIHKETEKNCGLPADQIETVTFFSNSDEYRSAVFVLHSREPRPSGFADGYQLSGTHRSVRYGEFTAGRRMHNWVAPLDDRTIAVSFSEEGVKAAIDGWRDDRAKWTEVGEDLFAHQFYFGLNRDFISEQWTIDERTPDWLTQSLSVLWEKVVAAGSIELSDNGLKARIIADCGTPTEADRVVQTGRAAAVLTRNFIDRSAEQVPRADRDKFVPFRNQFEQAFQSLEVTQDGSIARAEFSVKDQRDSIVANLLVWTANTRLAARRVEAMNNIRMVALAMHNYHDANKSLPPAIVTSRDGRHRHSWRIALLPYLDHADQYNAYRFDEPWNSPHNAEVTEHMPPVYSRSFRPGLTTPTVVLIDGKGCVFDGQKKTKLQQISDGTSNSILLVGADISGQEHRHWADPDSNIEFDVFDQRESRIVASQKDFEKNVSNTLGSGSPGHFIAAFSDGSVQVIRKDQPFSVLMNLFSSSDGAVVDRGRLK